MKKMWILLSVLLAGVSVCGAMEDGTAPLGYTPVKLTLGKNGVIVEGSLDSIQGAQRQKMMRFIRDVPPKDLSEKFKAIGITLDADSALSGRVSAFRGRMFNIAQAELAAQEQLAAEEAQRATEALESQRRQEADAEIQRLAAERAVAYPQIEIKVAANGSASVNMLTTKQLEGLRAFLAKGTDAPSLTSLGIKFVPDRGKGKVNMREIYAQLRNDLGVETAPEEPAREEAGPVESGEPTAAHQEKPVDGKPVAAPDDFVAPTDGSPVANDDDKPSSEARSVVEEPTALPAASTIEGSVEPTMMVARFDEKGICEDEDSLAMSESQRAAVLAAYELYLDSHDRDAYLNSLKAVGIAGTIVKGSPVDNKAVWAEAKSRKSFEKLKEDRKNENAAPVGDTPKLVTPPVPPVTPAGKPPVVPTPAPVAIEAPKLAVDENTPPTATESGSWHKPAVVSAGLLAGAVALGANDVLIKENRADLVQAWHMVASPETRALLSPAQKRRLWRVVLSGLLASGSAAALAMAIASALGAPEVAAAA